MDMPKMTMRERVEKAVEEATHLIATAKAVGGPHEARMVESAQRCIAAAAGAAMEAMGRAYTLSDVGEVTKDAHYYQAAYEASVEYQERGLALGHTGKIKSVTFDDTYHCSCGWKSNTYWDGAVWAFREWANHVVEMENVAAFTEKA